MIVTLTGVNGFLLRHELQGLVGDFLREHGDMGLERLDGQEAEFERLQESLQSLPFLSSKKLVVLREPSANKKFTEHAEKLLGEVPETTDVILVEPKLDKRLAYYKYLKKHTDFREFAELDANSLSRWLVEQAKERGGKLSPADARYLVERIGENQQSLAHELDKLLLYEPNITRQTIELLADKTPQSTIFELLEAAFAGHTKKALELYQEQRAQKVEPQQIIAMLAWQLHVLAVIKMAGDRSPDTIAKDARLSPFVVRKSSSIASRLSVEQLKQLVADLLTIDARLKRESLDADEALQNYLLSL